MDNLSEEDKNKLIFFGLISIVLLGALIYSNILHAPFVYDDYSAVVDNETIKSLKTSLRDVSNNRYLTSVSFALNYAAGGIKPFGYHLVNNLVHVINALLIYYFIVLTFKTPVMADSRLSVQFIAFSTALIFIAHPIQTQAVTYVAQRSTSMTALFYLISLVMYVKARLIRQNSELRTESTEERQKTFNLKSLLCYLTSIVCAILAMKTKEIAFTLPVIIILYEFCFFTKTPNRELSHLATHMKQSNWRRFIYLLPILLTILIIPLSILDITMPIDTIAESIDVQSRETANISRTDYLLTQFRVIMTYLRLLVLPVNQSIDYTYPVYHSFFNLEVFLSFLSLLVFLCSGIYLLYRSRFIAFGIFWFFITLSVESSIIPIKDVIFEHRLYLPSIGFFIAAVSSIECLLRQTRIKIVLITAFVVLLSIGAYNRNIIWKDPQTLWEDVILKFPNNPRAYNNLGVFFKDQDEFDKAVGQFEKALKINHNYTPVYYNLGDIQYRLGNYEGAIAYFKKALKLKLSYHLHLDILTSLAINYSETDENENAVNTFKEAVRLYSRVISPYNNLGRQYIKMGKPDLAIEILEKALKIREVPHLYSNLSAAYNLKGDEQKSKLMYQKAMELKVIDH